LEVIGERFQPAYETFWILFNQEKFFEAHEVLEALWKKSHENERLFYQGLIQIAAAFVHIQRKNPAGAEELLHKASQNLATFEDSYKGISVPVLLDQAYSVLKKGEKFPKQNLKF
jgi:uncharacterized protein